jgi:hypothetical protein
VAPALTALLDEAQRSERTGQREMSRRRYESVLYMLRDGEGAAASAILRRIARTYIDEGQFDAGLDCATAAQAERVSMTLTNNSETTRP